MIIVLFIFCCSLSFVIGLFTGLQRDTEKEVLSKEFYYRVKNPSKN